jgi:DHA3 family macrolide efflux protein-like MFS transporter
MRTEQQPWRARFFTFWIAQAFSLFGSSLAQFALIWWLTETTGSATVLAIGSLAAMLPGIILGPLAGVLVDRWNRRLVILVADGVGAVVAAVLALLFSLGWIDVWHLYIAMAVRSLAGSFHFPSLQSSTSLMVPADQLQRVAGLNQLLQGAMQIVAPPLGALLVSWLPFPAIMGVDVVTALVAVSLVGLMQLPQPPRDAATAAVASIRRELREGLAYIWHWPGLRGVLLLSGWINLLLTPAFTLMPILATRHFGGGALELAWLNSALGVGTVAGGLLLSVWGGFKRRIYTSLLGLVGLGLGILIVGVAPGAFFWLALAGFGLAGVMSPLTNGPFFAILQAVVAPEIQGRVFTTMMSFSTAMAPLGLALAGPVADRFGVQLWYLVGGAFCLLVSGLIIASPAMMRLEEGRRPLTPS